MRLRAKKAMPGRGGIDGIYIHTHEYREFFLWPLVVDIERQKALALKTIIR